MYRYISFTGFLNKQFEEPFTKEYSTGAAVVCNASNEEFYALLALQKNGKEITADEFTELIKESDQFKYEMSKLQTLFVEKAEGLKEMLADKQSLTDKYIDVQNEIYEYMYQFAKQGKYDTATNEAIINANEQAKSVAADYVILLNEIRSKLENMIKKGIDIEQFLQKAKNIDKNSTIDEIKEIF